MQTQVRPPRTRSSGGRTLMLLGLVLALAAAFMVFYITTSYQGTFTQTDQVVVAKTTLDPGTILSLADSKAPYMTITDAFKVIKIDKNAEPPGVVIFSDQNALNALLNNKVVVQRFFEGDFLRTDDQRIALAGQASGSSLTNANPSKLGPGIVIYTLQSVDNANFGVQTGDYVDIIYSNVDLATGKLTVVVINPKPVYVYAVDAVAKGKITLAVDEVLSEELMGFENAGIKLSLVIRSPGDHDTPAPLPKVPQG